jgi:hypothetical protein
VDYCILDEECKSLESYNALYCLRKCDNGAVIKELNNAWSKYWRSAESELLNVTRTQGGASSKQRKHDLSKLGKRSMYERMESSFQGAILKYSKVKSEHGTISTDLLGSRIQQKKG